MQIYLKPLAYFLFYYLIISISCNAASKTKLKPKAVKNTRTNANTVSIAEPPIDTTYKSIHVIVALCDNTFQGIVPVPAKIGNGQDAANNLYWGCAFGVKTYFKNSTDWQLISSQKIDSIILERIVFKHKTKKYYLIADAYNGKFIKNATLDFLNSSCGKLQNTLSIENKIIGMHGRANLMSYCGHDGLMDFKLTDNFTSADSIKRNTIILACYSKNYFSQALQSLNINAVIWSTGLMSPEAYTLHAALAGFVNNETNKQITERAAFAYSKYQKCSISAAKKLIVTD